MQKVRITRNARPVTKAEADDVLFDLIGHLDCYCKATNDPLVWEVWGATVDADVAEVQFARGFRMTLVD